MVRRRLLGVVCMIPCFSSTCGATNLTAIPNEEGNLVRPPKGESLIKPKEKNLITAPKREILIKTPKEQTPVRTLRENNLIRISNAGYLIKMSRVASGKYVSGCELITILNVLLYYGFNVPTDEFYNKYFPHQDWKWNNGIKAGHPEYFYVGNPTISSGVNCGFGCFYGVVGEAINRFFSSMGILYDKNKKSDKTRYKAILCNESTENLINNYVSKGIPVIIWCTSPRKQELRKRKLTNKYTGSEFKVCDVTLMNVSTGNSWTVTSPLKKKGEKYTWKRGEHVVALVGCDEKYYYFLCPFKGLCAVGKDDLNKHRQEFDNQAVYIKEYK